VRDFVPALPDIDANKPYVAFVMLQCRACGEHSDWTRADDHGAPPTWDIDHEAATTHPGFYLWSITRNTSELVRFPNRPARSARQPHAPTRDAGPCGCACTSGGFCGGCGHAGCGRRS